MVPDTPILPVTPVSLVSLAVLYQSAQNRAHCGIVIKQMFSSLYCKHLRANGGSQARLGRRKKVRIAKEKDQQLRRPRMPDVCRIRRG